MSSTPQIITSNLIHELTDQGPAGSTFGVTAADKISFYGAAPVAQNTTVAGLTVTPITGATTSIYVNTAFDGGITGLNYTVADIVTSLKLLGILKT
jgi:hypothetical protein